MQKIVFVLGNYKNGGMAMRATNLSNEFACNGFYADILVTKEMGSQLFFTTNSHVRVIDIQKYNSDLQRSSPYEKEIKKTKRVIRQYKLLRMFTKRFPNCDRRFANKIRLLRRGNLLRCYFLNEKPDIVISLGIGYLESVIAGTKDLTCKIFYAEKNAPEIEFPAQDTNEYKYFFSLLNQTDGIIVQTLYAKRFFDKTFETVYVINNPIKKSLPFPYYGKRKKTIVNFCRLSPQKNLDLLINAFALLHKDYPNYCLNIFGNVVEEFEKEYKKCLLKKLNNLKLNDCVFIFPPLADVHEKIKDCAMFVSSSDYEGLSNSMIEAMAIGLPCICTDCVGGGTREVMRNEENGLIVPVKDTEALYQAMKRFIDNPEFADKCGKNAAKLREKLAVEKIAQEWLAVMRR